MLFFKLILPYSGDIFFLITDFSDIVFLVDSSTKPPQFQLIKTILIRLANQLNVNIDSNRMALAQFSNDVNVEFLLNGYKTKDEIIAHIRRFKLKGGQPRNIGEALKYARTDLLTPVAGARLDPGFRQYVVVFASGKSDDAVLGQSQILKDQNIHVIAVGLDNADSQEIQIIATKSSSSKTVGRVVGQTPQEIKAIIDTADIFSVAEGNYYTILRYFTIFLLTLITFLFKEN